MADGVVMLLIGPDGYVWANASDFDRSGYGGFSLQEAQAIRCRDELARAFIHSTCNDIVAGVMGTHRCNDLVRELINRHGFTRKEIVIGHGEPQATPPPDTGGEGK